MGFSEKVDISTINYVIQEEIRGQDVKIEEGREEDTVVENIAAGIDTGGGKKIFQNS